MVEAVAGGHVEPRLASLLEGGQPGLAALAPVGERRQDRRRRASLGEQVIHLGLDGQPRASVAELVVGPVHDHVDAGHHAGHRLVADLRERLLAELEEHHVGAVAEHQELGVVVPHLGEQVDAPVEVLPHVVVLRHAGRSGDDRRVVELRQFRHGDRRDLVDQALDAHLPALVQGVPVLVVVARPLAEDRRPAADLLRVGDRVGGDVDAPVDDAVLDAERGGEDEHPRGVGPDRAVRDLGRDGVEGRHRLGEVHGVVEPETLVVLRLEPGEIRVHGPPALGPGRVRDLRRKREPSRVRGAAGGRPPVASTVPVHRVLLSRPVSGLSVFAQVRTADAGIAIRPDQWRIQPFRSARSWAAPQRSGERVSRARPRRELS